MAEAAFPLPPNIPSFECPFCKLECLAHSPNSWNHDDPACPEFQDFTHFDEFAELAAKAHGTTQGAVRDGIASWRLTVRTLIARLQKPPGMRT